MLKNAPSSVKRAAAAGKKQGPGAPPVYRPASPPAVRVVPGIQPKQQLSPKSPIQSRNSSSSRTAVQPGSNGIPQMRPAGLPKIIGGSHPRPMPLSHASVQPKPARPAAGLLERAMTVANPFRNEGIFENKVAGAVQAKGKKGAKKAAALRAAGYTPRDSGTTWTERTTSSAALNSAKSDHAERKVWLALPAGYDAYLIVQNAFPCDECHAYLVGQSANYNIVVRVLENHGSYALHHPGQNAPCTIYYRNSAASYNAAPAGFPVVPAINYASV